LHLIKPETMKSLFTIFFAAFLLTASAGEF
jgi:hypothetical protein